MAGERERMSAAPKAIKRTMATTLIMANQYSKAAEAAHAARIDIEQRDGEDENPEPLRGVRKPPLAIDGDSGGFAADGDALGGPIGVTDSESSPFVEIKLGIDAEGAGGWMGDSHFSESAHE